MRSVRIPRLSPAVAVSEEVPGTVKSQDSPVARLLAGVAHVGDKGKYNPSQTYRSHPITPFAHMMTRRCLAQSNFLECGFMVHPSSTGTDKYDRAFECDGAREGERQPLKIAEVSSIPSSPAMWLQIYCHRVQCRSALLVMMQERNRVAQGDIYVMGGRHNKEARYRFHLHP